MTPGLRAKATGGTAIGTEKVPMPVNTSGENFPPSPLIDPPADGNESTVPPAVASMPAFTIGPPPPDARLSGRGQAGEPDTNELPPGS
jgi:hypothetical protein